MKKLISVLLSMSLIASTSLTAVCANDDISVILEGKELEFDVAPRIVDESTMVPMRKIFVELGYYVAWNPTTQAIVATNGSDKLFMTINDKKMYFNDTEKELAVAPTIIEDTTFVPLRAISEAGRYNVVWDNRTRSVLISAEEITLPKKYMAFDKLATAIVSGGTYNEENGYTLSGQSNDNAQGEFVYNNDYILFTFMTSNENQKYGVNLILKADGSHLITVKHIIANSDPDNAPGTLICRYDTENKQILKISDEINKTNEVRSALTLALNAFDSICDNYGLNVKLTDFEIDFYLMDTVTIKQNPFPNNAEMQNEGSYYNALVEIEKAKEHIKNSQYWKALELCDSTMQKYFLSPDDKETFNYIRTYAKDMILTLTYYNAADFMEKIKEYVNDGLYTEAYELCDKVLVSYNLSPEDTETLKSLRKNVNEQLIALSYYNALNQVEKTKEYINSGLYLEAVTLCDEMLNNYNLSPDDVAVFEALKQIAQSKYDEYLADAKKWTHYYYADWCLGYTGSVYSPLRSFNADYYFQCYGAGNSRINIHSYRIGTIGDGGTLTSNLKKSAKAFRSIFDITRDESFDILSSNYTTVGNLNAYQETYRISEYKNRYHTKADYAIIRHIFFQFGDWIYIIQASQPQYLWSEDFYEILEKIRTTICFY